jgi:phosphatidylinositol 3,5-bisphosphate 5-phosphatase
VFGIRFTPAMPSRQIFSESEHSYFIDHGLDDSNFLDLDWLSSSGTSCEDDIDR